MMMGDHMNHELRRHIGELLADYQQGRVSRRRALHVLGALGLSGIGGQALLRTSALAQDAATPEAAATPMLGPQADGTNVWMVQVGGMDMENSIDMHAFF